MRTKIAVAAALLVIAGAGVAVAHGKRATPEQRAERLVARVSKELALDAEALKSATHANLATLQKSADLFIDRLAAFYATLTPAQRTNVAEKFEKLDNWRGGDGRGGNGRHGGRHGEKHDQKPEPKPEQKK